MTGTGTESSIRATKANGYFTRGTYYYIPVLPGTVEQLSFSMTSNTHGTDTGTDGFDDWKAERVAGSALTFTRGTGLKFDALDQGGTTRNWNWYFDIHDAASLERFRTLVAAGKFPAAGVAKFTSDIDLSGETLAAAAGTFSGTLDGQGHSITGWASEVNPLIDINEGKVTNFTIASSCDFSLGTGTHGFVVNTNAGTISFVTNEASLEFNGAIEAETVFGFIAGQNNGVITDCTNNGDISVIASSITDGHVKIGGLAGIFDNPDKKAFDNCINNGAIAFDLNGSRGGGQKKLIHIGGVVSGSPATTVPNEVTNRGKIYNCKNLKSVSLEFNTLGSQQFANVGGIAAYVEGEIELCENRGNVSLTGNKIENNYAVQAPAVGGIAGYSKYNVSGCNNYGDVSITSSVAGGTENLIGIGTRPWACVAGVVAKAGPGAASDEYSVSDSNNYGSITSDVTMSKTAESGIYVGGITGVNYIPVKSCTNSSDNAGSISVISRTQYTYVGGISAYIQQAISGVHNEQDVTIKDNGLKAADGNLGYTYYVGGLAGFGTSSFKVSGSNSGTITNNCDPITELNLGGLLGRSTTNTVEAGSSNSGDVVNRGFISKSYGKYTITPTPYIQMGGIVGRAAGATRLEGTTSSHIINSGNVTNESKTKYVAIGGILGHNSNAASTITYCETTSAAQVSTSSDSPVTDVRIAGIAASLHQASIIENCVNRASVDNNSEATDTDNGWDTSSLADLFRLPRVAIGGMVGYAQSNLTVIDNNNYGTISNNKTYYRLAAGGIVGNNYSGFSSFQRNYNQPSGIVKTTHVSVSSAQGTYDPMTRLGGLIGACGAANISDSKNLASVIIDDANTDAKCAIQCSGVVAFFNENSSLTNADNEGTVGVNVKSTTKQIWIAGICAYSNTTSSFSQCDNSGEVTLDASSSKGYSYASGIASSSDTKLSFTSCSNTADIDINCKSKWRIGGIAAYTSAGTFTGNTVKCSIAMNSQSVDDHNIGGLVGYSSRTPYVNCSYEGTIDASGGCNTANKGFSGGLLGSSNGSVKFQGCKVKAVMVKGTNSVTGAFVGGQFSNDNLTYTFEASGASNCKVLSGTTVGGVAVTDGSDDALLVGKRSDKNRTVVQTAIDFE